MLIKNQCTFSYGISIGKFGSLYTFDRGTSEKAMSRSAIVPLKRLCHGVP